MMYRTILFFSIWCTFTISATAQQPSGFFYFSKNVITEKTLTNSKGQAIGVQRYITSQFKPSGVTLNCTGQNVLIKEGKECEATLCNYRFENSTLWISMGKGKDNYDVLLDYPIDTNVLLKHTHDLKFSITTVLAGIHKKIDCRIDNRKILSCQERIITGQGEWDCIKTGYDMELKCFGIPYRVYVIEWFAPDMGIIRTDVLRNGKLYERRLLSSFKLATL